MTKEEVSQTYHVPCAILDLYEAWGAPIFAKTSGAWVYDDEDLAQLSAVMSLYTAGFTCEEIAAYLRLPRKPEDACRARLQMIEQKRRQTLEQIHTCDKRLCQLDYLRREMQNEDTTSHTKGGSPCNTQR